MEQEKALNIFLLLFFNIYFRYIELLAVLATISWKYQFWM